MRPTLLGSEQGHRGVVGRGRRKHPSDSRFKRGRGVVVALEWAGGVYMN